MFRAGWNRAGAAGSGRALLQQSGRLPAPSITTREGCPEGYLQMYCKKWSPPPGPGLPQLCLEVGSRCTAPGYRNNPSVGVEAAQGRVPRRPNGVPEARGRQLAAAVPSGPRCGNACAMTCVEKCKKEFCLWDYEDQDYWCEGGALKNAVLCASACIAAKTPTKPAGRPTAFRAANRGGAAQYGRQLGLAAGSPRCDEICSSKCLSECKGKFCPDPLDDINDESKCNVADMVHCAAACIKAQEPAPQPGTRPGRLSGRRRGRGRRRHRLAGRRANPCDGETCSKCGGTCTWVEVNGKPKMICYDWWSGKSKQACHDLAFPSTPGAAPGPRPGRLTGRRRGSRGRGLAAVFSGRVRR